MKTLKQQLTDAQKQKQLAENKISQIEKKLQAEAAKKAPKNMYDTINTLPKVYKHLKCDPTKDVIKIDKFSKEDTVVLTNIVARMRIAKVYNNGIVLKRGDKRWYPWAYLATPGPGLEFDFSLYHGGRANTSSAARLAFLSEEGSTKYFKNFQNVEEGIIGL